MPSIERLYKQNRSNIQAEWWNDDTLEDHTLALWFQEDEPPAGTGDPDYTTSVPDLLVVMQDEYRQSAFAILTDHLQKTIEEHSTKHTGRSPEFFEDALQSDDFRQKLGDRLRSNSSTASTESSLSM